MVIRGNSRGNPLQASTYLLKMGENEAVRILEVNGDYDADETALHEAVFAMGISSELSKSDKGLYHAQINPAPGEDKLMDDIHWLQAADILAKQLGLENQSRAIVLHTKKGRTHAHVIWERYDYTSNKMVSDSFSRLAQDRARKEMEEVFKQKQTPHRNTHRPELKAHLSEIWEQTKTGAEFIKTAKENGYLIGEGTGRNPFMVIDEFARSHNLPRQLKGVRLKDVRERLRGQKLMTEKEAIILARENSENGGQKDKGKEQEAVKASYQQTASSFAQAKYEILEKPKAKPAPKPSYSYTLNVYLEHKNPLFNPKDKEIKEGKNRAKKTAGQFKATKDDMLEETPLPAKEKTPDAELDETKKPVLDPRRAAFLKRMQEMEEERQRDKDKGPEIS